MFGGYPVYLSGLAWLFVWTLIGGFSRNQSMLNISRALQGLGPAAFLPSGIMLMGRVYRPGPRKNLVFSIYGGSAPFGFFAGVFVAGLTRSFLNFDWYFWIGSILILSTIVAAYFSVPSDSQGRRAMGIRMDWWGSALIISGLVLVCSVCRNGKLSHQSRMEDPLHIRPIHSGRGTSWHHVLRRRLGCHKPPYTV